MHIEIETRVIRAIMACSKWVTFPFFRDLQETLLLLFEDTHTSVTLPEFKGYKWAVPWPTISIES